jgi:phosphatidylinositol-3-phosphatase
MRTKFLAAVVLILGVAGVPAQAAPSSPRPDHVVLVMLENKRFDAVVGTPKTPWISALAARSATMTNFYAETHPSQPNYLALFSGSTQGVTDNSCPHDLGARPNLARQLIDAGHTFTGYAEDLPVAGWRGCGSGGYVRRHAPWANFSNIPAATQQSYRAFPRDYRRLPTVAMVIPNLCHDMHDCPKADADAWLNQQFTPYLAWAKTHNSLLVLTFDEDNRTGGNRIATIVAGAGVRAGRYATRLDHYDLLRTLEDMYALSPLGEAAHRTGLPSLR